VALPDALIPVRLLASSTASERRAFATLARQDGGNERPDEGNEVQRKGNDSQGGRQLEAANDATPKKRRQHAGLLTRDDRRSARPFRGQEAGPRKPTIRFGT
jgi:hypothetical protein